MTLFALIIGIILIVAAVRNSQGALFTALGTDAPKFLVWAAAILAIGAIGYIPGLKSISRWLLALIIIVLVVNNYQKLVAGFTNAWQSPTPSPSSSNGNGVAPGVANSSFDALNQTYNMGGLAPLGATSGGSFTSDIPNEEFNMGGLAPVE